MSTLWKDLRYAFRTFAKNPGFAAAAVLTLALGIGANAAIFSLVNAIILRPLPYPQPQQLVGLGQWRNQQGQGYIQTGVSAPNVRDIGKSGVFQQVAYYRWADFNITGGDRPQSVDAIKGSSDLLPLFGVPPLMGRFFLPEESQDGHDGVAVIGYRLWQMRYAGDPAILSKSIELNQRRYSIIGVMPASFRFTWDQQMDVFVPQVLTPDERSELGRGTSRDLQTQARLKQGVSIEQAQAAMNTLASALAVQYPAADKGWGIKVEPLHAAYYRHMETPLMIMLGAVMLVLLIACVNVANLLLARATGRKREIAIRIAIGASRTRLLSQLLTESLLLATCGGACGLLLAFLGDRLLTVYMASYHIRFPNASTISIDWRVLLFSIAITLATGVIFGLAPSWTAAKAALGDTLKESGVSTTTEGGRKRLRNALVVSEIALALVLLTGAGLLVRTFVELANIDLGIDPNHVVTMYVNLPEYKYKSPVQFATFYRDLMRNLQAIHGVRAAGVSSGDSDVFFQPEGTPPAQPGKEPTASFNFITPGYLKAMGTPVLEGRGFSEHDTQASTPVALISETVAHRFWPNTNPVGQHVTLLQRVYSGEASGSTQPLEVVGVVKDVRNEDMWRPQPAIYIPFEQKPASSAFLAVRTEGPPMNMIGSIRAAVWSLDKDQPINSVRTMDEEISNTYGAIRFPMALLWIFSLLALVLSAIGIFGVMSYTVSRRTKELAIRMALGASQNEMLGAVLREGLVLSLIGVVFGLIGALALSRVMSGYVFGITATDPLTFAATSLLLIGVALLATYIPARRAARVDPTVALRYE